MADLSPVEKVVVAGIVAPAFSKLCGKAFSLPPDHEELERRFSCDIVLRAEDGELAKFEHTRPAGEVLAERVHPLHGARIDHLIQECLNAHGARGVVIKLDWDPPPARREDQEWVARWMCDFILEKLRRGRLTYFALDVVDDWNEHLSKVAKWLSRIVIAPAPPDTRAGIIGGTGRMGHMIDDAARLREAIERKARRYGASAADVILLVDFDTFPLQLLDVPEALEVARTTKHPFREVWAINCIPGAHGCRRLWPPTPAGTTDGREASMEDRPGKGRRC